MIEAVFFDLDNTLVRTEWAAGVAVRHVVERYGRVFEKQDEDAVIGLPWETIFDNTLRKYGLPLDRSRLKALVLEEKRKLLGEQTHALPGAVEAVVRCARRWPVAVVSGSYRGEVEEALQSLHVLGLLRFFLSNDDVVPGKPDPAPYREAARRLGAEPRRCVVFEDSEMGLASAVAAGMYAVAVEFANDAGLCLDAATERIPSL